MTHACFVGKLACIVLGGVIVCITPANIHTLMTQSLPEHWHFCAAPIFQVRHLIEDFWKDIHLQHGYQLLYTPHIAKVGLLSARICGRACALARGHDVDSS